MATMEGEKKKSIQKKKKEHTEFSDQFYKWWMQGNRFWHRLHDKIAQKPNCEL